MIGPLGRIRIVVLAYPQGDALGWVKQGPLAHKINNFMSIVDFVFNSLQTAK
jgi:hypothetical protein